VQYGAVQYSAWALSSREPIYYYEVRSIVNIHTTSYHREPPSSLLLFLVKSFHRIQFGTRQSTTPSSSSSYYVSTTTKCSITTITTRILLTSFANGLIAVSRCGVELQRILAVVKYFRSAILTKRRTHFGITHPNSAVPRWIWTCTLVLCHQRRQSSNGRIILPAQIETTSKKSYDKPKVRFEPDQDKYHELFELQPNDEYELTKALQSICKHINRTDST
jgi:hypothetical protein